MRHEVENERFGRDDESPPVTFSAGVACWTPELSREGLVGRADAALYEAKRAGKGRTNVWIASDDADPQTGIRTISRCAGV